MGRVAFAALVAACCGVCGVASAADLSLKDPPEVYVAPALAWTGFYVGANIGGGRTSVDIGDTFIYEADPFAANSIDENGLLGGIQLGYNYQRGNVVLGVEAGLGYIDISGSKTADLPQSIPGDPRTNLKATYETDGGLVGELTGRLGYASNRTLLFVKGGAAILSADFSSDYVGNNCSVITGRNSCGNVAPRHSTFGFDNDDTLVGWTLGVGIEYALTSNWSLKAEYQHYDFGTQSFSYAGQSQFGPAGTTYNSELSGDTDVDYTVDAVKVGVNYRFNGDQDDLK